MSGLRTMLQAPLILLALGLAVFNAGAGAAYLHPPVLLALALCALLLSIANAELLIFRPLRRLGSALSDLCGSESMPIAKTATLADLDRGLCVLRERIAEQERRLAHEVQMRQQLEANVRELEQRYVLSVEQASDGMWNWNLRSNEVEFSPRWRGMLSHMGLELRHIDAWKALIHPDDRSAVQMRLDNHLQALTPHFDAEYRIRDGHGRYHWVASRGTSIHHASGKPYRMFFVDNDIDARKKIEDTLIQTAEGLSSVSGMDFFRALILHLSKILGTRDNLVCYCVGENRSHARTLAYIQDHDFHDNIEYELAGTSCGAVIERGEIVYVPTGVCEIWPLEKEFDRDSYIGVPMFDSKGRIIGHFACMDGKAMQQDLPHLAIFKIFSVRAAAELERMMLARELEPGPSGGAA